MSSKKKAKKSIPAVVKKNSYCLGSESRNCSASDSIGGVGARNGAQIWSVVFEPPLLLRGDFGSHNWLENRIKLKSAFFDDFVVLREKMQNLIEIYRSPHIFYS